MCSNSVKTNGTYKVSRDLQSPIDSQRHSLAQLCIFLTDCLQANTIQGPFVVTLQK